MKTAKLFRNGRSQAVRLPKEFRMPGDAVRIKRVGAAVVLLPLDEGWEPLFESLSAFTDDFMDERRQQAVQPRQDMFDE